MAAYIMLVNWTEQGVENVADSPGRLDAGKDLVASLGGEVQGFFLTMGRYDMVVLADLPDDEAAATAALTLAKGGSVRTETLKAFTEDEYREIVAGLS